MYRRAARRDDNEIEVVSVLRTAGCSVSYIYSDDGVPDLLVGRAQLNFVLEVKRGNGKLTPKQKTWFAAWNGQKEVVRDWYEALVAVGLVDYARLRAKQHNYEVKENAL